MTIASVRDGIKTALSSVSGLRCYDVWPDIIICPCAIVRLLRYDAHTTLTGRASLFVEVILLAAGVGDGIARGQEKLDAYLDSSGSGSIIAALESAATFTASCENSQVNGWSDYGSMEVGGIEYLGVRFEVECWVTF